MATVGWGYNVTCKLVGMPNETPPPGSVVHVEVTEVVETNSADDSLVEMVLRYIDHD